MTGGMRAAAAHVRVCKRGHIWWILCRRCPYHGLATTWRNAMASALGHLSMAHPQWPGFWDDHLKDMQDPEYAAAFRAGLSEPPC